MYNQPIWLILLSHLGQLQMITSKQQLANMNMNSNLKRIITFSQLNLELRVWLWTTWNWLLFAWARLVIQRNWPAFVSIQIVLLWIIWFLILLKILSYLYLDCFTFCMMKYIEVVWTKNIFRCQKNFEWISSWRSSNRTFNSLVRFCLGM